MAKVAASHEPHPADQADRRSFRWTPAFVGKLLRETFQEFIEDKCPKQAAALSYYALFALGPLLVLAIAIAGVVFGSEAATSAVVAQMTRFLGESGGDAVREILAAANRERVGPVGAAVGAGILLLSAGAVFAQLKGALNRIWEVEPKKPKRFLQKVIHAVRRNALGFVGVAATGVLLLASLAMSAAVTAVASRLDDALPGAAIALQAVNVLVSLALVSAVFAIAFKLLPDVRIDWRDVLVGAVVTGVLFLVGQLAIGYYVGTGSFAGKFGSGASFVVILAWVYYSSMIVFFGAELTQIYANLVGSRVRPSPDARSLKEALQEKESAPEKEGLERRPRGGGRGAV